MHLYSYCQPLCICFEVWSIKSYILGSMPVRKEGIACLNTTPIAFRLFFEAEYHHDPRSSVCKTNAFGDHGDTQSSRIALFSRQNIDHRFRFMRHVYTCQSPASPNVSVCATPYLATYQNAARNIPSKARTEHPASIKLIILTSHSGVASTSRSAMRR